MKSILVLFTACCFIVSLQAKTVIYPQLSTVIDALHNGYSVPASTNERTFHLAKKPAGWVLQWKDLTKVPAVVVEEELFWSAKKKKYVKLKTLAAGKTVKSKEEKYKLFSYGDRYSFSRIPYFGYTGWDRDVIKAFSGKKALSDTLLEGLARAYMNYAYGFTEHNYGYHTAVDGLDEKTKLDSFIYYSRMDISTMDKLRKQNPGYEMFAGNAGTKYSGDVMAFYDYLQLTGNEQIAAPYLNEELFTPVMLANAKASLSQCAVNAILFTNGDNDTYPLEYLQFSKGFRTDVTIINLSLLNLYGTIEQASRGRGKAKLVKFSYPLERYASEASEYFRMENFEPGGITYSHFLSKSYQQKTADETYFNYPQCTIEFSADTILFPELINPAYMITPRIRLRETYMLRSDFAQLDILMSNFSERPIYYAITTADQHLGFENYLFGEGVVKRFIPFAAQEGNEQIFGQNILPGICYDNLMKIDRQAYPFVDKTTDDKFVTNFRIQFLFLADAIAEHEPAKAMQLLDRCDSLFPAATWKREPLYAYGVQAYYKAGQFEKADHLALQMISDFEKSPDKKSESYEDDLQMSFVSTRIIKENAEKYNRSAVLERANKYLEKKPAE